VLISVLPPEARSTDDFPTPFALHQDRWNDYSFQTQYHLFRATDGDRPEMIGTTKILRRGQTEEDPILLGREFEALSDEWVSVGQSLDYYQRLNELDPALRDQLLLALRDAVHLPPLVKAFREEPGWNVSVFRGQSRHGQSREQQDRFLTEARAILTGNYTAGPALSEPLRFAPTGWDAELVLQFDAPYASEFGLPRPSSGVTEGDMPHRCGVLIGPNGSGKSTLLSRLARVAFASPTERTEPEIAALGGLQPTGIGFTRIVTVSYSAFDSFALPGLYADDLAQIARDVERGDGRFLFCGLRDVVEEVREDLAAFDETDAGAEADRRRRLEPRERRDNTHLKPLAVLADEFEGYLGLIERKDRTVVLEECAEMLLQDRSFAGLEDRSLSALITDAPKEAFLGWSTGHKIAWHVIAAVVAHAEPRSLVLFDEPETHLHPPLTAALMHALRRALARTEAFAIVATHSPVVLQETLARHVRIVRRVGPVVTVSQPEQETFGENVGTLTYSTFGLTADTTDFHDVLDRLVAVEGAAGKIDSFFEPGLSAQARAYVLGQLAERAPERE
jgi:energy-coupling factor transporter ATP-binding protein EcfA2